MRADGLRRPRTRRRIGIIAGSGPEAGIDLWTKVLAANRARFGESYAGDVDAPDVTVVSLPMLGHSMELDRNDAIVWSSLREALQRIEGQVDLFAIACNTLHHYEPDILALGLRPRFVSAVAAAIRFVRRNRLASVALLGSRPVMELGAWSPYAPLRAHARVEVPEDTAALHDLIYAVKEAGGRTPELDRRFAGIVAGIGPEVCLLACTELPLLQPACPGKRLVDVTALLAADLVALAADGDEAEAEEGMPRASGRRAVPS